MMLASRKQLEDFVSSQIKNDLVNKAFKKVDRKLFVPKQWIDQAYSDNPIPLSRDSSISQPSLVAQMIDLLNLTGREQVLEIGTASGYSAAILSLCCKRVDTIEIDPDLAKNARKRLKSLGFNNITVHTGNGSLGLPSKSPFDGIVVTAAAKEIPKAMIDQLKTGGRMVIPSGSRENQYLLRIIKSKDGTISMELLGEVRFVPLVTAGE